MSNVKKAVIFWLVSFVMAGLGIVYNVFFLVAAVSLIASIIFTIKAVLNIGKKAINKYNEVDEIH